MPVQNTPRLLSRLLDEAKRDRNWDTDRWDDVLRWFRGEQENSDRADFQANTVSNFLFSQFMTMVSIITSRLPEVNIKGEVDNVKPQADELTRLVKRIFTRNDFTSRQVEFFTNGGLFGKAYMKPTWDPRMFSGFGDVKIEVPDTRNIFLEPGKSCIGESNYVFEARHINKLTLYRMFPDKRDAVDRIFKAASRRPELESPFEKETERYGMQAQNVSGDPVDATTEAIIMDFALGKPSDKMHVEFVEAWFNDERTVGDLRRIHKERGGGNDPRPAFPTGRLIQFAGDEGFSDMKNPFPAFPYVEYRNYFIPGRTYGMSELEQALPLQDQYNIRQNQIFDMLNFNVAPLRFYDARSGLKPDEVTNAPNDWIGVIDVDGIKQFDPPGVQAATYQSLFKIERDIEAMFGVHEVTRGEVPGDVRSGFAVEQLQEQAQVRLRLKSRAIESAVKELARYLIWMIGQFYIPGVHYSDQFDFQGISPDVFEIEIKAGTNLPASRFAEQQFIQWAFSQRIVDEQYVIEHSQLPGKEAVIERMREEWQARRDATVSQAEAAEAQAEIIAQQPGGVAVG